MQRIPRLSAIATLMTDAPLLLSGIMNYGEMVQEGQWLEKMFRTMLPEAYPRLISCRTEEEQIQRFAAAWAIKYFPLDERAINWICSGEWDEDDGPVSGWNILRYSGLPYETAGFDATEDNLHFIFDFYSMAVCLMCIIIGKWKDEYGGAVDADPEGGLRIAWMETAVAKGIWPELLHRIPERGYDQLEISLLLRGTDMEMFGVMADWINNATGVALADEYP